MIKDIKGLDSCLKKLQKLTDINNPDSFEYLANKAEKSAKSLVPVSSGKLKDSIKSKVESDGTNTNVKLSSNASHASYIEYGTSKMPARPFLRPAMEQIENEIEEVLKSNIEKVVK